MHAVSVQLPHKERNFITREPYLLLLVAMLLVGLGVVMVFSSSAVVAEQESDNQERYLIRGAIFVALGLLAMGLAYRIPYRLWAQWCWPFLGVSLLLLLIVLFVEKIGGASRWIRLGPINVQPAEMAKVSLIIFLAAHCSKKAEDLQDLRKGFAPAIGIVALICALILAERDLGTPVLLGAVSMILLFIAGARLSHLGMTAGLAGITLIPLLLFDPERARRLLAFLNPWEYSLGEGYQLIQSWLAFGCGGIFGVGLGNAGQKLFYLPESHTDFIFSIIGEELGLMGTWLVVLLFFALLYFGTRIASRAPDQFGSFLVIGLTLNIVLQACFNMAVATGLAPTKGIGLPFISYGGSSLMMFMLSVGMILSVARHREE